MDDAKLNLSLRVRAGNGIGESLQTIDAGDQDILDAAVLQLGQHAEPELRSFGFGKPQAQKLLVTCQIDAQSEINGLVDDTLVLADFQHDTVQVDDGIKRIQWARLPVDNLVDYGIPACCRQV